jgi:hypothetical protein
MSHFSDACTVSNHYESDTTVPPCHSGLDLDLFSSPVSDRLSPLTRPARIFNANEFKHVEIVDDYASGKDEGDPRVEYLYCQLQFVGQGT